MDTKYKENMTEDPLEDLRDFIRSLAPHGVNSFRWYCLVFLQYELMLVAVSVYFSIYGGEEYRYCILQVVTLSSGIMALLYSCFVDTKLERFQKTIFKYCFSINSCGNDTRARISKECRLLKYYCYIEFISLMVLHFAIVPITEKEKHIICTHIVVENWFWSLKGIFFFSYYLVSVVNGLAIMNMTCIFFHIIFHIRFQFLLLNKYVEDMGSLGNNTNSLKEADYHRMVYYKITHSVKHHIRIRTLAEKVMWSFQDGAALFFVVYAMTIIVATSYAFYLTAPDIFLSIRTMIVLLVSMSIFAFIVRSGQHLINESTKFHDLLCALPWEYWNKRNRATLLIILPITATPMKVSCYGVADLNHRDYLSLLRFCWTILSVVLRFK